MNRVSPVSRCLFVSLISLNLLCNGRVYWAKLKFESIKISFELPALVFELRIEALQMAGYLELQLRMCSNDFLLKILLDQSGEACQRLSGR